MKMRHVLAGFGVLVLAAGLAACSGGSGDSSGGDAFAGKITGTITVLTNRTDIVNTTFKKYAKEFEKAYPGTNVKFEAITNYEQDVTTRLGSGNAGDVALIPTAVGRAQLPQFFEPLGSEASVSKTYRFVANQSYNGKAYGIPTYGSTMGFVYNKDVWKQAGITALPKTPSEFLDDLKQIKSKTSATPYYTNYHDQWPLSQWNGDSGLTNNVDAVNDLNTNKAPWSGKTYVNISDSLLFDIVHDGLSEVDPTTTAWESSKGYLAQGQIATMYLGSWAITQMQDAATKAGKSADSIGYMPFPYQVKGTYYAALAPDYLQGVTKASKNKPTAYAWANWFAKKSGYADLNGGVGATVGSKNPATLNNFAKLGVKYVEQAPAPKGKENLQNQIMKESQIDLSGGIYRQKLVDVARGAASGTKASYFASLNQAWGQAVADNAG
ncbi:extracellular solute-binding protein [Pseudolysinimonas kribbensis]|uniref:Sugar ABC transporter substrate-binding protein n=1 Tax=Pseudolysinimonas kribbensis TaxID=433641 RepID=A0ABQ6K4R7_9MICO|nr:ABC transporter substrate-binding protein [Pseudolysinimonas kribbensis]GMA95622.1 sugar ABC transporter substrate-binding protein [Pseudolysinimonas kribbensis]